MNSKTSTCIISLTLFAALAIPTYVSAQGNATRNNNAAPHHYKVIDMGTFGGPESVFFSSPPVESVNNRETVVGGATTDIPDPTCFWDCVAMHAFEWNRGVVTDLGTLPDGPNSVAFWVNEQGLVMGFSENGVVDPVFGPQQIAVVWKDGQIISLGTFGGGFSYGNAMNNQGDVIGVAANAIPDPFSFIGVGTQARAFLWRDGVMLDLGTLGGPDGWPASVNERGQIAGWALVDSIVNSVTGQPTQHPFLWESGKMIDLGTLGGTVAFVGAVQQGAGGGLNNRGQVIGTSNLAGDLSHHPFLWDRGVLVDLGTLGGENGEAWWINEAGEIVGRADFSPYSSDHHAFLWKKGKMIDLGGAPGQPCSTAIDVNSSGQVIIDTGICGEGGGPGMLWENGHLYDLNSLIPANSGLVVGDVSFINDRREIAAQGNVPNGDALDAHAILLVPCDQDHPGLEGCDYSLVDANTATQSAAPRFLPNSIQRPHQSWRTNRFHMSGPKSQSTSPHPDSSPTPYYSQCNGGKPGPPAICLTLTPLSPGTVSPGGTAVSTLGVTGVGGFYNIVGLSCSVQPSPTLAPTCSIRTIGSDYPPITGQMSVLTIGPTAAVDPVKAGSGFFALWLPLIGLVGAGVGSSSGQKKKRRIPAMVLACMLLAGSAFLVDCGGGSSMGNGGSSPGTPKGTYTITVTGIPNGAPKVSATTTLTVQ